MSTERHSRLPSALRYVINGYRRRWRAICAETGLFITLAVLAATVGLAIAADRLLRLSPALRAFALATIAVASAVCLVRWALWPALRRMRDRQAAARLGHHFRQVEEDLVSAVELSSDQANQQGISQGLIASALEQITRRAEGVDYRAAVPLRPLLKAGAVVGCILTILGLAYAIQPSAIRNALARVFRPGADLPYFSYTRLTVEPGNTVVRRGDSVTIVAATEGRKASVAYLRGSKGDGSDAADRIYANIECTDGVGAWDTGPLFRDFTYRVRAGDDIGEPYRIRVIPPPSLSHKSAAIRKPDYAGGGTRSLEKIEGPVKLYKGEQIVIRAMPTARGDDPKFACSGVIQLGEKTIRLTPDDSGVLVSDPFAPVESAEAVFTLTDGYGLTNSTPETVYIRVVPDRTPVVTIPTPGRDLLVLPGELITLEIVARDEFGLRNLNLRTRAIKGQEAAAQRWQRVPLEDGGPDVLELIAQTELSIDALGLEPGDLLEYKAEAADYADDAILRRGYSPVYRFTILSEMEHIEKVLRDLKNLQLEMLRRAATQKTTAAQAGRLAQAAQEGDVSDAAGAAENRELEQARATEALARKLERLIPEIARNDTAPTDMLGDMERISRGVRSVAREDMKDAADEFGKAAEGQEGQQQGQQGQEGQQGQPQEGQEGQQGQPQEGQEGQQGQPQEGQQGQQGQQSPLRLAQSHADEAARKLEQLAQLAERMQRRSILEKLAAEAEALAARERELKDNLGPIALRNPGAQADDMPEADKQKLERLVAAQRGVKDGIESLGKEIEKASAALAFSDPKDAEVAEKAKTKLDEDKTADNAAAIAQNLADNVLFSQIPEQEKVARSLKAVADILRKGAGFEEMDAIAKELDEFIQRQKAINSHIEAAIEKAEKAMRPTELGGEQAGLQRDVSEQASALHWLAREIELFRSQTAEKLDGAAREMGLGTSDLYRKALPEGLEHGKRALALLEDAREKFDAERQQMQQAADMAQMMQALLLLQRCLIGQKRVNKATVQADKLRLRDHEDFNEMAVKTAKKQSRVRVDAKKLQALLAMFPNAAKLVGEAGKKMDFSRVALGAGDTGSETRGVQRQALALLEKLIEENQNAMAAAAGAAGARAQSMMGMIGASPGGYEGGTDAPIMPATNAEAKNEDWSKVRSRFREKLGAAFEGRIPTELRGLVDAYFNRLRKEPPR